MLAQSRTPVLPSSVQSDMRRMSIVMAVAALDTYMHRLVLDRAYKHKTLPKALANFNVVTFAQLLDLGEEASAAARKAPHNSRPKVGIKRHLRDSLLRRTFQNHAGVSDALALAGKPKAWDGIGAQLQPVLTSDQIQERLNAIVMRRNQIVHEGDYLRMERPRGAGRNRVTHAEATSDIDFVARLIDAIHAVV